MANHCEKSAKLTLQLLEFYFPQSFAVYKGNGDDANLIIWLNYPLYVLFRIANKLQQRTVFCLTLFNYKKSLIFKEIIFIHWLPHSSSCSSIAFMIWLIFRKLWLSFPIVFLYARSLSFIPPLTRYMLSWQSLISTFSILKNFNSHYGDENGSSFPFCILSLASGINFLPITRL